MTPFERELSSEDAAQRLADIMSYLGLVELERQVYPGLRAVHFRFRRLQDGREFAGSGKGEHHILGGLAEVVEHYFTETQGADHLVYRAAKDVAREAADRGDPLLASLTEFGSDPILCQEMADLTDGASMYVPVRLMNPDILLPEAPPSDANHFLARYSSNNGTAFGLSRTEALLHALNEAHERDWLSRLFLWAALGDVCPVAGATALHHPSVAALLDSDLAALPPAWVLLDVPSGPVRFCAVVEATPPGTGLSRLGSGASTCPVHALRRAAHEYAQAVALEDESTREEDACIASFLRASPTLAPLAGLEAAARLAHVTPPLATEASRETAEEALHRILHHPRRLPAVAIFHPVGAPADLAGVVCQCYCPGAERFHLIRAGNPVAPMRAFK